MPLPKFLKKYFWEIDFNKLNLKEHKDYISERLLEYGDERALSWLFKYIDKKTIKDSLINTRELSLRSANFWALYFNVPKNKVLCLKKSYQKMRKSHWPY